ncbi:MAG: hypothetical protein WDO19_05140 [Bacteroidota bacterium]
MLRVLRRYDKNKGLPMVEELPQQALFRTGMEGYSVKERNCGSGINVWK